MEDLMPRMPLRGLRKIQCIIMLIGRLMDVIIAGNLDISQGIAGLRKGTGHLVAVHHHMEEEDRDLDLVKIITVVEEVVAVGMVVHQEENQEDTMEAVVKEAEVEAVDNLIMICVGAEEEVDHVEESI